MPHPVVKAGHRIRVVAGVRSEGGGERQVMCAAAGPHGGENGGEPGPKLRVAGARSGIVDGRVHPRVTVAVAAQQCPQGGSDDRGVGCQPAGQPYGSVESSGACIHIGEPVVRHTCPRLFDVGQRGLTDL